MTRRQAASSRATEQRWEPGSLEGARLAIYTRASEDTEDTETSVKAQQGFGETWAAKQGITDIVRYCDNDKSASMYATKNRDDFDRMWKDIEAGRIDLVWVWKTNRLQRTLETFVKFRGLCQQMGVGWVVKRRLFNLNDPEDLRVLGNDAVNGEIYSIELSDNVKLGHAMAAQLGKPHAATAYGYKRRYNERGRFVDVVPDGALREAIGVDGESHWWSPAGIVQEIIERIAAGDALHMLKCEFDAKGIPRPRAKSGEWTSGAIRNIALNLAYIGILVFNDEVVDLDEPPWEALVDEETFYAATNVLRDPTRRTARNPPKAFHLLSGVARCAICFDVMTCIMVKGHWSYRCRGGSHAFIRKDALEEFTQRVIIGYLSRPDVANFLLAGANSSDRAISVVRAEIERLRGEVENWRRLSESGEADAITATRSINGLRAKIEEQETKLKNTAIPPALRGVVGPQAEEKWKCLGIEAKKRVLRACTAIHVAPTGQGRVNVPVIEQVTWRWTIGPDATLAIEQKPATSPPKIRDVLLAWFREHGEVRTTADAREFLAATNYKPHDKWIAFSLRKLAQEGHLVKLSRGTFIINQEAAEVSA